MPRSHWMYLHSELIEPLSYFVTKRGNPILNAERVKIKDYRLTTLLKTLYHLRNTKSMFHDDLFLQSHIRNSATFNIYIELCLNYGLIATERRIEQKYYKLTESGRVLLDIFIR